MVTEQDEFCQYGNGLRSVTPGTQRQSVVVNRQAVYAVESQVRVHGWATAEGITAVSVDSRDVNGTEECGTRVVAE